MYLYVWILDYMVYYMVLYWEYMYYSMSGLYNIILWDIIIILYYIMGYYIILWILFIVY